MVVIFGYGGTCINNSIKILIVLMKITYIVQEETFCGHSFTSYNCGIHALFKSGSTINIVVNLDTGFIPLNLQLIVRMITMKVSVIFVVSDSKLVWQSIEIACNSQQKQSAMYLPYLFRLLFFC